MPDEPTRTDRRRERTRAALVAAAQTLIAEGRTNVAVLEITQLADVGLGSFYNHFDSKDALWDAAVNDALERHGALLDELTADIDDPAVVFAHSVRLTGRLHRTTVELSKVLVNRGVDLTHADHGLAPRALRDIEAGVASGRFRVRDTTIALTVVGGAVLALGALLHADPERDAAASADEMTEDILRMLGVPEDEARRICALPLPDLEAVTGAA
ncbi:TetR/AcrR family transcriptional regulator [Nocardioides mangrovi]|uniref:TetR/AcrR family transcriptional regulator n=1 Tax=Nocardioides mangrovi TaxID=2874580 RepID=A0ABS7UDR4_9ACTN|nr:TetR/AcrR family transcriptional regulator [Nocardioides mangrovi]MBZ5739143.1 TetR/AcrR family transcriptional regulator [Nocardioides mangrovi]